MWLRLLGAVPRLQQQLRFSQFSSAVEEKGAAWQPTFDCLNEHQPTAVAAVPLSPTFPPLLAHSHTHYGLLPSHHTSHASHRPRNKPGARPVPSWPVSHATTTLALMHTH